MSELTGLVHAHTWHSFDCLLAPAVYLGLARRLRLDFLCITDHNTLAGSRAVAARNRDPRLEVVIGAEYATERGDVIGLFLRDEVRSREFDAVLAEIRSQGGLALLPHPYRGRHADAKALETVDLVEVFNARSSDEENGRALADASLIGKPELVGADIHTTWELLNARTLVTLGGEGGLRDRLLHAPRRFTTRSTSRNVRRYSQVIKRIRARVGLRGHA